MTLPLLNFQATGADFLAGRERAGLFDEMGVGKTAQAIGALDRIGARRIIVVAPAAVREVWAGEFRKFATVPRKVLKGKDIHDLGTWLHGRADVLLLSYELATKWAHRIEGDLFDALVFDEAHYLKSPTSQRTRAMLGADCDGAKGLARWAARTWFLTGTVMANDPMDVWPFLRFSRATPLTQARFTSRYFKVRTTQFGTRSRPRDEMVPELQMAIRSASLRRTAKEAGLQLPHAFLTTTALDGDGSEVRALLAQWPDLGQAILDAVEKGGLSFIESQHVATLRRLIGEAKAPPYLELIAEELANGKPKVVIMGVHTKALSMIAEGLRARGLPGVELIGSTPERQRVDNVNAFQNDPAVRWLVGNLRAAGTGHTLHAACDLDMFEWSWAPADNAQAIKRVHRIGQEKTVRGRFISLAGSLDETMSETVADKTAAIFRIESGIAEMPIARPVNIF